MKKKVRIDLNDLKEGMIAAEQVVYNDIVLVSDNMILTEDIIKKLQGIYFESKISVYEDVETEEINEEEVVLFKNRKILEKVEKNFKIFSSKIEDLFLDMDYRSKKDLEEVRNFAKKIQNELSAPGAIIKNIVLYGSGEDVIYRHSVNVAALSSLLGKWIGLSEKDLTLLTYAAILHDFGKIKIDKEILYKSSPLTEEEFQIIKGHSIIGYELVKQIPYINNSITQGVLMHHERLDGSGYPLGLKEDKIHTFAKIIAIADTFDAINSNRVYKTKKNPFEALETVKNESLGKFDYRYSKIFIEHIVNFYIGESVILNTDEVCKIISVDINNLCKPLLLGKNGFIDLRKEKDLYIKNLAF